METTTPFELNLAIQLWRENLGHSPAFRSENLDELESHLRDSVATLEGRGLSTEEAFVIAAKRIGKEASLEKEFEKINERSIWFDRVLWMLIGLQFFGFVSSLVGLMTRSLVSFGLIAYDFDAHGRILPGMLSVSASLLGFGGSLAVCWWFIFRRGSHFAAGVASLLRRHHFSYLAVIISCGLILYTLTRDLGMAYGITMLQMKFTDIHQFSEINMAQRYSWIANSMIQSVTFVLLTLLLARKRLRLGKA